MVSYDTPTVATQKVQYIRQHGLGGAMWWESSGDAPGALPAESAQTGAPVGDGQHASTRKESLIALVAHGLGGFEGRHLDRSENELNYAQSRFRNVKAGMPGE